MLLRRMLLRRVTLLRRAALRREERFLVPVRDALRAIYIHS
jgi:hypothetical protein